MYALGGMWFFYVHVMSSLQSPSNARISDGVSENPNLKDNWDDAEGYYRE